MKLADLIQPDRIILGLRATDKTQLLREMARRASASLPIEAGTIFAALDARERLGSTGFGRGFALPHVRLEGLQAPFSLLVRVARPVEFDAIDGKPVDIVFMLLIPPNNGNDHVAALAAVSRSMRDEAIPRMIRMAGSSTALFEALAAVEP